MLTEFTPFSINASPQLRSPFNLAAGKGQSFVLGKRRVVDRPELDRFVEHRNAMARTEASVSEKEETIISLKK